METVTSSHAQFTSMSCRGSRAGNFLLLHLRPEGRGKQVSHLPTTLRRQGHVFEVTGEESRVTLRSDRRSSKGLSL